MPPPPYLVHERGYLAGDLLHSCWPDEALLPAAGRRARLAAGAAVRPRLPQQHQTVLRVRCRLPEEGLRGRAGGLARCGLHGRGQLRGQLRHGYRRQRGTGLLRRCGAAAPKEPKEAALDACTEP
jgi:hypothetical protein